VGFEQENKRLEGTQMSFVELCWVLQVQNTVDDIRHHLGKLECEGTHQNPDKWITKVSTVMAKEMQVVPERTARKIIGYELVKEPKN
jgi:hypothetical protein